jgi:hypothetical protein
VENAQSHLQEFSIRLSTYRFDPLPKLFSKWIWFCSGYSSLNCECICFCSIQDGYHPTTITVMDLKDYAPLTSSHQAKDSEGEWSRTKESLYLSYLFFGLCAVALIYKLVSLMRIM